MAAPNRPEPETGTALALTKEDRAVLTALQQQEIALRKQKNLVIAKLAETSWGKGMAEEARRAVADWGDRNGVDVTTEINVLGGNIYLNHQFYLNRLAEMAAKGEILDQGYSFINNDVRLLPDRDAEEIERRRQLRIFHNAPEAAKAICVFHAVFTRNPHTRYEGCKWTGTGKLNNYGKIADPVGEEFPTETAISRAARRCLKFAISQLPARFRAWIQRAEDDAVITVGEVLEDAHKQMKADEEQRRIDLRGGGTVPVANAHDDYTGERRALPAAPISDEAGRPIPKETVVEHVAAPARKDREAKREPVPDAPPAPTARQAAQRPARGKKADADDQAAIDLDDQRLAAEERERTESLVREGGHELEAEDL